MFSHLASMLRGGLREHWIETEGWKSLAGTSLVGGGDEVLFGNCEGAEMRHEQENR